MNIVSNLLKQCSLNEFEFFTTQTPYVGRALDRIRNKTKYRRTERLKFKRKIKSTQFYEVLYHIHFREKEEQVFSIDTISVSKYATAQ